MFRIYYKIYISDPWVLYGRSNSNEEAEDCWQSCADVHPECALRMTKEREIKRI